MKIHHVSHIYFFEPYLKMDMLKRIQIQHHCIEINKNQEFNIEEIFNSKQLQNRLEDLNIYDIYEINK